MKKTLSTLAALSVASAAFGATQSFNFSWTDLSVSGSDAIGTTVPGFSAAGTLTQVAINVTGVAVVGNLSVKNVAGPTINTGVDLFGSHVVTINGLSIADGVAATAASQTIALGETKAFGPLTDTLLGSNTTGLTAGWTPGPLNVLVRIVGGLQTNGNVQNNTVEQVSSLKSTVTGTITYTYEPRQDPLVPEAETYVAGLAMAGLVGYGFYRRSRKA